MCRNALCPTLSCYLHAVVSALILTHAHQSPKPSIMLAYCPMACSSGTVSFAVMFVANFPHPKKYRDPGDVSNAAEMLAGHLPEVRTALHEGRLPPLPRSYARLACFPPLQRGSLPF